MKCPSACGCVYIHQQQKQCCVRDENVARFKGCIGNLRRKNVERWMYRGGGSWRLPCVPWATLQAHTLTSKWYPLSARGLVGPCPPPLSLHTSSCSCWIIDISVLHAQHLPGHGSVTPNGAWLREVLCIALPSYKWGTLLTPWAEYHWA